MPTTPDITFQRSMLEGFTKTIIAAYLVLPLLRKRERADLVVRICITLIEGADCTIFSTQDFGLVCEQEEYLIHGPGRYIVKGHGETVEAFHERDERLTFFFKPGFASPASLPLPGHFTEPSQQEMSLERDTTYRYSLASKPTFLTKTNGKTVELATQTQTIQLKAALFWNFVFASADERAEISVAHAATLLGLSTLTLNRRIGEGKLPAVRASSSHPGIRREGLEEYIAYRLTFPQGCISPGQVTRYETWRTAWKEQYQHQGDRRDKDA